MFVRLAGTQAPTGFKFATPRMEPNPKFEAITRLPIVGWTKEDGSYAIDENYNELQNIMQESQDYILVYESGRGDPTGNRHIWICTAEQNAYRKGGTIRKGKEPDADAVSGFGKG